MALAIGVAGAFADTITTFTGGSLSDVNHWDNGLPAAGNVGALNVDGDQTATTVIFFSGGIINHTGGTITAGNNFNMTSGTWNMSGGAINMRYGLVNSSAATFNLRGGLVTVTQNYYFKAFNTGILNVSG